MIRTGIPCGYLFIALFLCGALICGLGVAIVGWCKRSRLAIYSGLLVAVGVIAIFIADVSFEAALEWNPVIRSDGEIIGSWTDKRQTIILAADKTFTRRTESQTINGTWKRDDWNLYLQSADHSDTMRFIKFRGGYRLMTRPPEDPDIWDGDLGLSRIP